MLVTPGSERVLKILRRPPQSASPPPPPLMTPSPQAQSIRSQNQTIITYDENRYVYLSSPRPLKNIITCLSSAHHARSCSIVVLGTEELIAALVHNCQQHYTVYSCNTINLKPRSVRVHRSPIYIFIPRIGIELQHKSYNLRKNVWDTFFFDIKLKFYQLPPLPPPPPQHSGFSCEYSSLLSINIVLGWRVNTTFYLLIELISKLPVSRKCPKDFSRRL